MAFYPFLSTVCTYVKGPWSVSRGKRAGQAREEWSTRRLNGRYEFADTSCYCPASKSRRTVFSLSLNVFL